MVISLTNEVNGGKLYIIAIGNCLRIKESGRSWKEKDLDSHQAAIDEAEKIANRRLKTNRWKLSGKTLSEFYLKKLQNLEQQLTDVRKDFRDKGFNQNDHYIFKQWPAEYTHIRDLELACGINSGETPSDYQDFLMSFNGSWISGKCEKNQVIGNFEFRFTTTYRQQWFQSNKNNIECLKSLSQPFIVVSEREGYSDFLGAVLTFPAGSVKKFYGTDLLGDFDDFQDYFAYEMREIPQDFHEVIDWVYRKAGG